MEKFNKLNVNGIKFLKMCVYFDKDLILYLRNLVVIITKQILVFEVLLALSQILSMTQ